MAEQYLEFGQSVPLIPILDFFLVYNSGIAFSILDINNKMLSFGLSILGLLIVGYLTWYNGLKASGRYKGFNWEEWFWFGFIPLLSIYLFYFIWKPEAFKTLIKDIKSLLN